MFFTKNMYVITLVIEYEKKVVIAAVEKIKAKEREIKRKKKKVDTFKKEDFKDNTIMKEIKTVGEIIKASEPRKPTVSKEEMDNVLGEYEKEVEAL